MARTAKRTASCPHQITIQPQTARQDGRRLLAHRAALYYRLRQRSPVPVGVILQPLSPVATLASLGSALPYVPPSPAVEPPMSLTRELNKKQSPFRQLVEGCAPALAIAGGRSPEGKRVAERLGFYDLVKARSLAPLPDGVTDARRHSPTVGMAFDIRTRMMLGEFEPRRSASAMGMDVFNHLLAPLLPNGQHISDVLGDAFLEAERLTRDGDDVDQDYASIIFAWCESLYRASVRAIRSSLGERLSAARNVDEVYDSIPPLMLEDIARLRIVNQRQIKHWRLRMQHGAFFISNPSFSGDFLVSGADGDWFIDDALFDFKVKDTVTAPWVRKTLMQLLGYLILDLDNDYQAKRIGVWLPRQATVKTWTIEEILGSDASTILAKVRRDVLSLPMKRMEMIA